jgi:hypothetical protein
VTTKDSCVREQPRRPGSMLVQAPYVDLSIRPASARQCTACNLAPAYQSSWHRCSDKDGFSRMLCWIRVGKSSYHGNKSLNSHQTRSTVEHLRMYRESIGEILPAISVIVAKVTRPGPPGKMSPSKRIDHIAQGVPGRILLLLSRRRQLAQVRRQASFKVGAVHHRIQTHLDFVEIRIDVIPSQRRRWFWVTWAGATKIERVYSEDARYIVYQLLCSCFKTARSSLLTDPFDCGS